MPRIIVEADDSTREVVHWERVSADDFGAEHFRRCLSDRIAWAVADAEDAEHRPRQLTAGEPERDPEPDLVYA